MAVTSTLVNRTLTLALNNGTTVAGNAKVKNRSFTNINPESDDAALFATANTLAGLMANTLTSVYFNEKSLLSNVEDA